LLSRIAGLIRQRFLGYYLATSPAADAFTAALRIPNFLQNLLGEGVLSASFIPVYASLRARGNDAEARKVAGAVAGLLTVMTGLRLLGKGVRLSLGRGNPHAAEVVRNFLPVVAGRGVVQLSAYVDMLIASFMPTGTVAAFGYAQTIYLLPVSLFGMAVSAAAL